MFENLSDRLQSVMHKIKGYGRITEDNIQEMMREIRLSLLEADVNYKVVKEFTNTVKEKALGTDVNSKLSPGEAFVKIIKDELTELLGGDNVPLETSKSPTITMLVGLQGSGKTTTIGKLANFLRKNHKKKPLLVACDIYRPAAIDQLITIGKELNIEVYSEGKKDPIEICKNALNYAKENNFDYILIDTAGRLHNKANLMSELSKMRRIIDRELPDADVETLMVLDATTGQNGLIQAEQFLETAGLTGIVLTKLDGTAKGGVVFAIASRLKLPVKFVGVGEGIDDLIPFNPKDYIEALFK